MDFIPLELMTRGEHGEIVEIHGDPGWIDRMAALGVRAGGCVEVLQPGATCVVRVGESRLTLRSDDAFQIFVRPISK